MLIYASLDDRMMRVSVEAYGCTLNQGESRFMEELLEGAGHKIVQPDDADTSLVVTCCVIESTERRMLKRIRELAMSQGSTVAPSTASGTTIGA